tara:strand:- start:496 stop:846 length:351 start_codon:yes stop_codon:yes gene_type:complete
MTAVKEQTKKEEKKSIWSKEEKEKIKSEYGCDIVVEDGSLEDVRTKKAPTDSYIIHYLHEDKLHFDLTRGTKIKLFDMYWDKFKDGLKSIDYGSGTIKPYLWGYQSPTTKKKKRKV